MHDDIIKSIDIALAEIHAEVARLTALRAYIIGLFS